MNRPSPPSSDAGALDLLEQAWSARRSDPERSRALRTSAAGPSPRVRAIEAILVVDEGRRSAATPPDRDLDLEGRQVPPRWAVRARVALANLAFDRFETEHGCALAAGMAPLVEASGDTLTLDDRASVANVHGRCAFRRQQFAEALRHFDEAARLYGADGHATARALCLLNAGNALSMLDDPSSALQRYHEALDALPCDADPRHTSGYIHGNIAVVHWRMGLVQHARRYALTALDLGDLGRPSPLVINVLSLLAQLDVDARRLDEAARWIHRGARMAEALDADLQRIRFEALRASWEAASGRPADALARLQALPEGSDDHDTDLLLLGVRAQALADLDRHADVIATLDDRIEALAAAVHPVGEQAFARLIGAHEALGDETTALRLVRRQAAWQQQRRARLAEHRIAHHAHALDVASAEARERGARAEARRLHDQLVRAQRLEAVGQLAAGVAHDFANLLTVILGGLEVVGGDPGLSTGSREALGTVREAGDRARDLTRRLMTFARQAPADLRPVDAAAHLRALAPMVEAAVGARITVVVDAPERLPPVLADPGLLDQVVLNLAINARDAIAERGRLTLHARADDQHVRIRVHDDGAGIPPHALPRIFDPFFTTKAAGEGTGLGLAMVWGIVRQLGGDITVDSTPGEGTTFVVALPIADDATGPSD